MHWIVVVSNCTQLDAWDKMVSQSSLLTIALSKKPLIYIPIWHITELAFPAPSNSIFRSIVILFSFLSKSRVVIGLISKIILTILALLHLIIIRMFFPFQNYNSLLFHWPAIKINQSIWNYFKWEISDIHCFKKKIQMVCRDYNFCLPTRSAIWLLVKPPMSAKLYSYFGHALSWHVCKQMIDI